MEILSPATAWNSRLRVDQNDTRLWAERMKPVQSVPAEGAAMPGSQRSSRHTVHLRLILSAYL